MSLSIHSFASEAEYINGEASSESTPKVTFSDAGKSRNWCITSFDLENLPKWDEHSMKYMVYQKEKASTGRVHYQIFVQFKNAMGAKTVQNKLQLPTAHVERAKGTAAQARAYCMKEDTRLEVPVEHGEWAMQQPGKRTDLEDGCELVKKHGLKRLAEEMPSVFVRCHRGMQAYRNITMTYRTEVPKVVVLYGETGAGKSRSARNMMPRLEGQEPPCADFDQFWVWDPSLGSWFQNYDGHKYVIFEEFRGQLPFGVILTLLDRYHCQVQNKGGSANWLATRIVITSPVHPREWYTSLSTNDGQLAQLMRRITDVFQLVNALPVAMDWAPSIEGW